MKHGALVRCHKCGHVPTSLEDKAKHVMTSDHCLSHTDMDTISAQIQSGHPRHFDRKQVEKFMATLKPGGMDAETKEKLTARLVATTGVAAAAAVVFWFFHWLTR